jgi:hypothetical protein
MYRSELSMLVATAVIAVTLGVTKDLQNPPHGPGGSTSDILIAEEGTLPQTQQGSNKTPPVPDVKEGDTAKPSGATADDAGTKSDKQPDSQAPQQ